MIYKVEKISSYTESEYLAAYEALPSERRKRADSYKKIADKKRCVFSSALLMRCLKEICGIKSDEAEFVTDSKGKPHLKGDRVHFSISHSGDFVACAVSDSPVGIDIEVERSVSPHTAERICNSEELRYVFGTEPKCELGEEECRRFLRIWTVKEAYLKYTGTGITGGFNSVNALISGGEITALSTGQKLVSEDTGDYVLAVVWDDK